MRSIVMSTSWGRVDEPQGYDTSSASFKCLVEDSSSSEDSEDSDEEEEEEDGVVAASTSTRRVVKYKKIITKEPLLPE